MDVEFRPRGTGWRQRGRPKREAPPALVTLVRETYDQACDAAIPCVGSTEKEIREVVSLLKLAATQQGLRARTQYDLAEIRFYVEDQP